ncbi:MAG: hypothetical protein GY765_28125 [bacterium]|nr:hypothetical protein [bacterium]
MFGIKFIKFDSMNHVVHFKHGKIKTECRGLSFFYFSPNSSIAAIPLGSNDLEFIFNESTLDFQTISIQGRIIYKSRTRNNWPNYWISPLTNAAITRNAIWKK